MEKPSQYLTLFQRKFLEKSLQEDLPKSYRQRLQIMLMADNGKSQTEICQILRCCPATARHWMHIARSGMAHQWQDCPIGGPKLVNEEYLELLKELVTHSPRDYGYSFRTWTAHWLCKHLARELGISVSDRHLNRLLKQMGVSTKPKPSNADEGKTEKAQSTKILIRDLESTYVADEREFLPINFAKLGTNSDIYGARSLRAFNFSATAQQYFGLFPFQSGISVLS